jgi:hypothetical protein
MSHACQDHVLEHSKTHRAQFEILMRLAYNANVQGMAWTKVGTLMAKTGYTRQWVETILQELVNLGEIRRIKVGRSYHYQLHRYDYKTKICTCQVTVPTEAEEPPPVQVKKRLGPGRVHLALVDSPKLKKVGLRNKFNLTPEEQEDFDRRYDEGLRLQERHNPF